LFNSSQSHASTASLAPVSPLPLPPSHAFPLRLPLPPLSPDTPPTSPPLPLPLLYPCLLPPSPRPPLLNSKKTIHYPPLRPQVEASQSMIRIVGLSATLPNYQDVAAFLRVNPTSGLFHFDSSYRPVPLELGFSGVTVANMTARNTLMNQICYDKVGGWGLGAWGLTYGMFRV
jgi:hypothetical protein